MEYTVKYTRIGKKTTIALLTVESGFEIVGTSACVNPDDYDFEVGKEWALKNAISKLEDYKAFMTQITFSTKKEERAFEAAKPSLAKLKESLKTQKHYVCTGQAGLDEFNALSKKY